MREVVYVQDVKTGTVHKRFRDAGSRSLYAEVEEAADTSGAFIVLTAPEMERVEADSLCRKCWEVAL